MKPENKKNCDDCKSNVVKYCDGYILKDWSGNDADIVETLPSVPDSLKYWTYQECRKNAKGLKFLNLIGDCAGFERK